MEILSDSSLLNGAILLTLLAFILILLAPQRYGSYISVPVILYTAFSTSWLAVRALLYQSVSLTIHFGNYAGDVLLKIDSLSAWFILIINFTFLTGGWYGLFYMNTYKYHRKKISLHAIAFLILHMIYFLKI